MITSELRLHARAHLLRAPDVEKDLQESHRRPLQAASHRDSGEWDPRGGTIKKTNAMKNRIHVQIALVGGQPTPVYQGIVHLQPDQVVLICSEQTQSVAKIIRSQLPYTEQNVMIYTMSDKDIESMYQTTERIEEALPKGITISLNITGGMKLWSIIFNNVFRRHRRSCRTFFIGQNGTYFDLKDKLSKGKVEFDMDAQFRILGHQLDEFTPLTDYTSADFDVLNRVQSIALSQHTHWHFFNVTALFLEEYKEQFGNISLTHDFEVREKQNMLSWNVEEHSFECQLGYKKYTFASEHVEHIVLNTGWFELHVARMIAQKYGAENVRLNCIFRNIKNLPKNEIDIIVNTGSKLIFVECKTQIYNTTDVDKFRSAVRNYGGLGSKPLFITNSEMKPEGLEKCRDHRIDTFYLANPLYTKKQDCIGALSAVLDELDKTWNV